LLDGPAALFFSTESTYYKDCLADNRGLGRVTKAIPQGPELRERLRTLDPKERWRLFRVARRGEVETDPKKAAIVVGMARQQLKQQFIIVAILVGVFVGLPLLGWVQDPTSEKGASLVGGIVAFLAVGLPIMLFFARRFKRAERLNLEVAESARSKGKRKRG
jgi:hypothetical protein